MNIRRVISFVIVSAAAAITTNPSKADSFRCKCLCMQQNEMICPVDVNHADIADYINNFYELNQIGKAAYMTSTCPDPKVCEAFSSTGPGPHKKRYLSIPMWGNASGSISNLNEPSEVGSQWVFTIDRSGRHVSINDVFPMHPTPPSPLPVQPAQ